MRTAGSSDIRLLNGADADQSLVLLDGFHAVKHAVRFGAELLLVATSDEGAFADIALSLAPDLADELLASARVLPHGTPPPGRDRGHRTGVWGVAPRPAIAPEDVLAATDGPIVLLEHPRHAGNVGASVRVAAAAGAAGVLVLGDLDPWSTAAVRGAAGLQYALPVARTDELPETTRPLVAVDPKGTALDADEVPADALLAFGSERDGLTDDLRGRADALVSIPMEPGVSSLNLAVSVGVVLFALR